MSSASVSPALTFPPYAGNLSLKKPMARQNGIGEQAPLTSRVRTLSSHLEMYLKAAHWSQPYAKRGQKLYGVSAHEYVTEGFNGTALKLNQLIEWGTFFFLVDGKPTLYRIPNAEVKRYLSAHVEHLCSSLHYQAQRYNRYLAQFSAIIERALQCSCRIRNKAQSQYRLEGEFNPEASAFRDLGKKIDQLLILFAEEMETVRVLTECSYSITQVFASENDHVFKSSLRFPYLFSNDQLSVSNQDVKATLKILELFFDGTARVHIPERDFRKEQASCSFIDPPSPQHPSVQQQSPLGSLGYFDLLERLRLYQESWVSTLRQVKNLLLRSAEILEIEGKVEPFSLELIEKIKSFFGNQQVMTLKACPPVQDLFKQTSAQFFQKRDQLSKPAQVFLSTCYERISMRMTSEHGLLIKVMEKFRACRESMIAELNHMTRCFLPGKKVQILREASGRLFETTMVVSEMLDDTYRCQRLTTQNLQQLRPIVQRLKTLDLSKGVKRLTFEGGFQDIQRLVLDSKEGSIEQEFESVRAFYEASLKGFSSIDVSYKRLMEQIQEMYLFVGQVLQSISSEHAQLNAELEIDSLMRT